MDIFSLAGKITVNYGDAVKGIDEVSSKAQNLASSLGKTMQDAGQKITSVGDKISSAGKSLAPVSVAVGGVATAALKTSMDFDSAMSKVKAISGATGDDFQALRDKAIEMGGKTKFSVSEAAEAFSYMAMAGWKTEDMLSGIEGIMNLAAASGENLATTSDIVTDALTAFGLSASDSGHFADILAAAATSANTDVYKMGETFKYAAPVMGALGYSAEDTSLAIGLMGDSSIKAGMAGTVLRSSFSRLANPTDAMVESMIAFGLATQETGVDQEKLEKAQRKVEKATIDVEKKQVAYNQAVAKYGANSPQAQKALLDVEKKTIDLADAQANLEKVQNTLVGTGEVHNLILNDEEGNARSLRDVIIFLRESLGDLDEQEQAAAVSAIFGTEAMSGMLAIINASDEDFNELASAIDGCDGAAQEIAGTMQDNLAGQITELMSQLQVLAVSIIDLFTPAMRGSVSHVQNFVSWLISLDDGTKTLIGTIALVVAGLSPVLITGGKVISGIGKIIGAIGSITGAIGKVISAVSSVTGAIGKVITIVPKIVSVVSSVIGFITGTVIPFIGTIVSAVGLIPIAIAAVIGVIILLWNKCDWFREAVIAIWEAIKSAAIAVWNAIKDFLVNLWDGIVQIGKTVFEGLASFFTSCWQGIQAMFTTVLSAISTLFSTIWNAIKTVVITAGTAIQTFLTTAWNTIKTFIATVLTAIKTLFSTVWNAIKTVITTVVNAIKAFITTAWNTIKSTITNILNGIKTVFSTVWNGIKSVVTSVINAIKSFITSAFNAIKTTITNVLNGIKNTVSTIWNGIKSVISNVLNGIKSTVSNIWNGIKSTVSNILNGIKSTVSNVWNGIKSTVSTVMSAIQSVISTVMNSIKTVFINGWNSIKSTTSNVLSGIKSTISSGLEGAKNAAGNALGAIKDKFSSTFENSKNIVKSGIGKIKNLCNFSWSLPKLKLPHFSISGKFSLDPPSIPKIGVEWYKKAMDDGMIMNQPTIFGYNPKSNQFLAGGEAGSETVVGTESLMNMIKSAASSENGELIGVLNQILQAIVSLDEGLEEKLYNALLNTKFQINEREFARLVRAV